MVQPELVEFGKLAQQSRDFRYLTQRFPLTDSGSFSRYSGFGSGNCSRLREAQRFFGCALWPARKRSAWRTIF